MPVSFTEPAANVVLKTLREEKLPEDFGIHMSVTEEGLSMTFTNDKRSCVNYFGLRVSYDPGIEEDIIVDVWTHNGKSGLIFLGREEYGRKSNGTSTEGS